jgi:hypothetical protein
MIKRFVPSASGLPRLFVAGLARNMKNRAAKKSKMIGRKAGALFFILSRTKTNI